MQFKKKIFIQVQVASGGLCNIKFFEILNVRSQGQMRETFSFRANLNCIHYKYVVCPSTWRECFCPEQVEFFGFLACSFHKV